MRSRAIRKAIVALFILSSLGTPLMAEEGMDLTIVDGAVKRELERSLSDIAVSLDALNAAVPDRLSPEKIKAAEYPSTPEGKRDAYITDAILLLDDPLLLEAVGIADGAVSSDLTITGTGLSDMKEMSLVWYLEDADIPVTEEKPEERSRKRLDITLESSVPFNMISGTSFNGFLDTSADRSAIFGGLMVSYGYDFSEWCSIGVESGVRLGGSVNDSDIRFMVPLTFSYTVLPYIEGSRVSLPITLGVGGYFLADGNGAYRSGPMADIAMALAIDVTPSFSLEFGTGFSFLLDFTNGDTSALLMWNPLTITLGVGLDG